MSYQEVNIATYDVLVDKHIILNSTMFLALHYLKVALKEDTSPEEDWQLGNPFFG